jgi:hypothetical protein
MFMPVTGASGTVLAVLRAEKSVQIQSGDMSGTSGQYFSKDELEALDCLGRHCGSILQVASSMLHVLNNCLISFCRPPASVLMKLQRKLSRSFCVLFGTLLLRLLFSTERSCPRVYTYEAC